MKRFLVLPVLLSLGLVLTPVRAAETAPHYLAPGAIDLKAVVPPPPEAGSVGARGDLETVLQVQAGRTPIETAWARLIERDTFLNHAQVLGPWFTKENLPLTMAFLKAASDDLYAASKGAKELYPRPRPFRTDPAVRPCVEAPSSGSYPSGHSAQAFLWAEVLSDVFPEYRTELLARAHQAAWGRVIGGVHFPSDLVGGRLLAEAVVEALRKNPAYRADLEKCRAEVAPFLLKKAA